MNCERSLSQEERILGPKRDEEMGGWRKLHNEELHNLYSSPSVIRTKVIGKAVPVLN
jgi:hypothetical protein